MKRILLFLMLCFCFSYAKISDYLAQPNNHAVIDEAGILRPQIEEALNDLLIKFDENSTNQISVVSVKSLGGYEIEEFANEQARFLALGQKKYDNGILLLVAPNERKVRIEVGYGLEGVLTDGIAKRIIDYKILPHFKAGDYENGVVSGVLTILDFIENGDIKFEKIAKNDEEADIGFIIFMIFFFIVLYMMSRDNRSYRARNSDDTIVLGDIASEILRNSMRSGGGFGRYGGGFGGGFSNGGGFGGGFSGGGGGFGGGGASGSW